METSGALRTYLLPGSSAEIQQADPLRFQFRTGPLNAARLTDPEDPRTIATWSLGLGTGFIAQRSNVTILNNVIYPERGDRTILAYELDRPGLVTIQVFTLDGSVARTIHRGRQGTGSHRVVWDGTNNTGRAVARGIYFIRLVAPGVDEYRKVMVVREQDR